MVSRTISIDYIVVQDAINSWENLDALTLVIQLKANFINSALYQWSYRKVMAMCHCNFSKAKEMVRTAMKKGWVKEKVTKSGNKYLVARKLTNRDNKKIIFHIAKSESGVQIYFSRKRFVSNKGLKGESDDCKIVKMILDTYANSDMESYFKAKNKKTRQSFKDIRQKILEAIFIEYIQKLQKPLNSSSRRGMGVKKEVKNKFYEEYKKHGVSYKKIAKQYGKLGLTEYQVSNIAHSLKKQGLIKICKANELFFTETEKDFCEDAISFFNNFNVWNDEKQVIENCFNRCFHNKYVEHEPNERLYYIRNARVYHSNAVVIGFPQKAKKKA